MKENQKMNVGSAKAGLAGSLFSRTALVLAVAAVMAGCSMAPKAVTQEEVRERVKNDTARMYTDQAPITGPISMEEAVARALKYNLDYRLKKELWAFTGNRISVRFEYEWHDDAGFWFRSHGNEQWEFDEHGLMRRREASINDVPIKAADRKFHWPRPVAA